jgi:predicted Ser/Thr protein kinase
MQTILVLDNQTPSVATKALEGLNCILVVVNDVARARHVLLNMHVDLWICDLTVDELDYRKLRSESMMMNAPARILLTGPSVSHMHAATLIKQSLAHQFIAKPWPLLPMKNMIAALLHREEPKTSDKPAPPAVIRNPEPGAKRLLHTGRSTHLQVKPRSSAQWAAAVIANEGRYRLDELLGEGGMGRIYRAYDQLLNMEVAVKLLNHDLARDEEAINSLKEETRLCLQLLHRHIVRIFNLEKRQNNFLIIMEYVKGSSLFQLLEQMPDGIPPEMVAQIVMVMADALGYAHRKGVLHKDITPGNVLIADDGVLKLIDFGIADRLNRQRKPGEYVIGTPVYMSPEQLRGDVLDVRADVYSFGVLTHQMLTHRLPSVANATVEDLAFHPHPPLLGLPEAVRETLETALAFDVDERWPTVTSFAITFADACVQSYPAAAAPVQDLLAEAEATPPV